MRYMDAPMYFSLTLNTNLSRYKHFVHCILWIPLDLSLEHSGIFFHLYKVNYYNLFIYIFLLFHTTFVCTPQGGEWVCNAWRAVARSAVLLLPARGVWLFCPHLPGAQVSTKDCDIIISYFDLIPWRTMTFPMVTSPWLMLTDSNLISLPGSLTSKLYPEKGTIICWILMGRAKQG